jgi:hypothetical protein
MSNLEPLFASSYCSPYNCSTFKQKEVLVTMVLDRIRRDEGAEKNSSRDKQSTAENNSKTFVQRGKRSLGVATMALLASAGMIETVHAESSNQVKKLADSIRNPYNTSERSVSAMPEAFSHPNGPTVDDVWPSLGKEIDEWARKEASKNSLQGEAQGIHLKKKELKIARLSDKTRLMKMTPREEISSSKSETHQGDKGKEPLSSDVQSLIDKVKANPDLKKYARKLLAETQSKEASPPSSEIAPTSSKDVVGPTPLCLQDGFPATYVSATGAAVEGGGTTLVVDYSLSTVNNCQDPINNVQFEATEIYTCPAGCTQQSGVNDRTYPGIPSTIGHNIMSKATAVEFVACKQADGTPTVPDSLTVTTWPVGVQNGNAIQGAPKVFYPYPS